jgi:hypothetical protein
MDHYSILWAEAEVRDAQFGNAIHDLTVYTQIEGSEPPEPTDVMIERTSRNADKQELARRWR